jgi:hypothetical protein
MHDTESLVITNILERPIPFRGSKAEERTNLETHQWVSYDPLDGDTRCIRCDVGLWMTSASFPCGSDVMRQRIITLSDGSTVHDHEYQKGKWRSDLDKDLDHVKRPVDDSGVLPTGEHLYGVSKP